MLSFARDTRGATSIEYAIIAAGISVVILTVVYEIGGDVKALYGKVKF